MECFPRSVLAKAEGSARETQDLLNGQHGIDALLLHHDHDEPCWLRRARVSPDRVHIIRALVESLSRGQGDLLAAADLLDDGSFQHVDQGVRTHRAD